MSFVIEFVLRFIGWILFVPVGLALLIFAVLYFFPPAFLMMCLAVGTDFDMPRLGIGLATAYFLSLIALVVLEDMRH